MVRGPHSPQSNGGDYGHGGYPPPPHMNGYSQRDEPPWRHPEDGYQHSPTTPSWHDR